MTDEQRKAVIEEAKTWIGTPYAGHSHLKGCGADCGQVLYGIFRACRLLPEVELPKDYSLQVAQHMASTDYINFVNRYFMGVAEAEVKPGDVVLYKLGHAYAHAALIVEWPNYVLHAIARHGFSGAHGSRSAFLRGVPRVFRTLRPEYAQGGF